MTVAPPSVPTNQGASRVMFAPSVGFRQELNRRVESYFASHHIAKRDHWAMYLKTVTILLWVFLSWGFVLFGPPMGIFKILGCFSLGLALAGVGFSIGHDANHGGYSNHKWINQTIGFIYDFIGVSSYLWRFRHNFLHHTYTNILGHDVEIHGDGLIRMAPTMPLEPHHRYQHLWIWFIYPWIPLYWAWGDVQIILWKRHYHGHPVPPPAGAQLAALLGIKALWLGACFGVPLALGYSLWQTLLGFLITYGTYGLWICTIFMLAHVLEDAQFIQPEQPENYIEDEWAIFQVKTTVDFAPKNWFLNWYLGGLNYQVVHHLFPHICHVHYPKIAPILTEVCQEFGVTYHVYDSFAQALVSNYRWLKRMGTIV